MTGRETTHRDVRWLQRRTNIADLLDDGIENGSDLASGRVAAEDDEAEPGRPVAATPQEHVEQVEHAPPVLDSARPAVSWFGVLIGLGFIVAGIRLSVAPIDLMVYHARMKRPSFVEHVTPERSRIYGIAGAAVGVGLLGFALHRPRR